ncbi:hypothetical protein [uncultured Fibrobacter sp.]|uniref:hypothetical protein n=1 Tax=uncultured Fibrobacter sp. TaxID=261512 RepID=UPI0025976A01|nr:hypothetical protein [uncultured Fibrobacter sp.]
MFFKKSRISELESAAEELLGKNLKSLQKLSQDPSQTSLPKEKQLTLINSTIRLVQANRRLNDNFKRALLTFFTSVLSSSLTSFLVLHFFQP